MPRLSVGLFSGLALLTTFTYSTAGEALRLRDGGIHLINDSITAPCGVQSEDEVVTSDPTEVNIVEPALIGLNGFGNSVLAKDASTVNVVGGTVLGHVLTSGGGFINIFGGTIAGTVFADDTSLITISGGAIAGQITSDDATIRITGDGFLLDGVPVSPGPLPSSGVLTGFLADLSPINSFVLLIDSGQVILSATPDGVGEAGVLVVAKSGSNDLLLSWSPGCSTGSTYAVYEGWLGDYSSHLAVECALTTTSVTLFPPAFSTYYLIVPRDSAGTEGSYGQQLNGIERPQGGSTCAVQVPTQCE